MDPASSFVNHYDDFYTGDESFTRWRAAGAEEKAQNIMELWRRTGVTERPSVVDIGCGNGAIAERLASYEFFRSLQGYDVSSSGIGQAKTLGIPGCEFRVSAGPIPCADKSFDLAILSHVVEHVDEPRTVLREAARVAHFVVVEVPLEHNVRNLGDFQWTDLGHVNFYNMALIRQLMQSSGIGVEHELVTVPGRVWAKSQSDRRAQAKWWVKRTALAAGPLARSVMTFHGTLIGRTSI